MFLVAILAIIFLGKSAGRGFDKIGNNAPGYKEPIKWGYSWMYCHEMIKRDMVFSDGCWIPKNRKNDIKDEKFIAEMREKDLVLDRYKHWEFTGKTLEKLRRCKALYYQQ